MPEDEAHELPLPRATHPTTSQTTQRKGGEDFPFERHSRRYDKSSQDPVLDHNQRIVRSLERSLRVPTPLPTLKLYQTHPARRRLRPSPRKTGAPSRGDDTGERGQADTQSLAPRRDDPWNSILYHRTSVQKRRQHTRRVSRIRRHHNGG